MLIASSRESYGVVARLFHWGVAALILVLMATGIGSDVLPRPAGIQFHKALGIIALVLGVGRLLWWVADRVRPQHDLADIRERVAHLVMMTMLGLGVLLPVSGWLLSSAAGKPISLFGMVKVPLLLATPDKALASLFEDIHGAIAYTLLALVLLHIAGALFHHIKLKDDVLARMAPHVKRNKE